MGSLGGLLALQRGEAHLAGSHLLDEETGDYNVSYIRQLLTAQGVHVVLLGFVDREQGLIVPKGNPKTSRPSTTCCAGMWSSSTGSSGGRRVLLDYALKQRGLNPRRIADYERQEYTHLAVAATVKSGAADTGLGILAASRSRPGLRAALP